MNIKDCIAKINFVIAGEQSISKAVCKVIQCLTNYSASSLIDGDISIRGDIGVVYAKQNNNILPRHALHLLKCGCKGLLIIWDSKVNDLNRKNASLLWIESSYLGPMSDCTVRCKPTLADLLSGIDKIQKKLKDLRSKLVDIRKSCLISIIQANAVYSVIDTFSHNSVVCSHKIDPFIQTVRELSQLLSSTSQLLEENTPDFSQEAVLSYLDCRRSDDVLAEFYKHIHSQMLPRTSGRLNSRRHLGPMGLHLRRIWLQI